LERGRESRVGVVPIMALRNFRKVAVLRGLVNTSRGVGIVFIFQDAPTLDAWIGERFEWMLGR
jgi:hypothetical protein